MRWRAVRRFVKALLILLILAILAGTAGIWYLSTGSFQELVRSTLKSRLEEATGLLCEIDSSHIDLLGGRFELRGVRLAPRPGSAKNLELSIEKIQGTFRLVSLWSRRISLTDMRLARPRFSLAFGKDAGSLDTEALSRTIRASLEFGAEKVTVEDGSVALNDLRIPLNLTLHDLVCELRYMPQPMSYHIRLAYKGGQLAWDDRDLVYDLDARLVLTQEGLGIESFEVRREKTVLTGHGEVKDWKSPVLRGQAQGKMAAEELALFHRELAQARGDIQFTADFRWDSHGFYSAGDFFIGTASYQQVALGGTRGRFELKDNVFYVRAVEGRAGVAKLRAEGAFQLAREGREPHRLNVSVRGMALQDVARIFKLPGFAFDNTVDSDSRLTWRRGLEDLEVSGTAKLHGGTEAVSGAGSRQTELEGEAEFQYRKRIWYVPKAVLRSARTVIEASAHEGARFHLTMRTSRLAEPLSLVQNFSPAFQSLLGKYPDLMEVSGSYELDGDIVAESAAKVLFEGQVKITGGRWRSYRADSLTAEMYWDGKYLGLDSLKAQKGEEMAEGNFSLELPSQEGLLPDVTFRGSVRRVAFESLEDVGLQFEGEPRGHLSGSGFVSYTEGVWSGEGDFKVEDGILYGERFDAARGRVKVSEEEVRLSDCEAMRGPARANVEGTVGLPSKVMNLAVRVRGLSLKDLAARGDAKLNVDGSLHASGEVHGTPENPAAKGSFTLSDLRYESWELGKGSGTVELKDKFIEVLATVQSELGSFKAQARVSTEPGYYGKAHLELKDWNTRKVIAGGIPPYLKELSTALEGTLDAEGRFSEPSKLTFKGEMDGARFKINEYELHNSGKIRFVVSEQKVRVEEFKLVGEGSNLVLSGVIPLSEGPGLNLRLDGALNLASLLTSDTKLVAAGASNVNIRVSGSLRNPQFIGRASLNNCRFDYGDLPFHFSSVQGELVFSTYSVRVENLRGRVASGSFQINGSFEHQNAEIRGMNLQLSVRGIRLTYPKDFRTTLDGDVALRGTRDTQVLTGDVNILRAEYVRDFNLLEQLTSKTPSTPGPLVADPLLAGLRLDISIRSEDGLVIDNELLRLQGRIQLTLRGTPAYPSLTGRVEANEGSIFFRGNRFEIVRAAADFVDRNRINPQFEVRAEANVRSYRLILDVTGDLDNLRSNLRSDPPLATVDIVTLLATGKERDQGQNSRRQAEITGVSAASILSESLTGVIGKRVGRLFGLESFRVDPFLAGVENDPTARVTISERLSKDLTVTFSRNLSTAEEQIIILEYDVNRNLSVIATRDEDGKFAMDFRFRRRFR